MIMLIFFVSYPAFHPEFSLYIYTIYVHSSNIVVQILYMRILHGMYISQTFLLRMCTYVNCYLAYSELEPCKPLSQMSGFFLQLSGKTAIKIGFDFRIFYTFFTAFQMHFCISKYDLYDL